MNNYLLFLKSLAKLPRNTLIDQSKYWETLDYELEGFRKKAKHPHTRLKIKTIKFRYPQIFKDLQTLNQANKEIQLMIRS